MLLGLSKIIDCPGASVTFSTTVDLSDLCYGVSYPVSEPVAAEGTVRIVASGKTCCTPWVHHNSHVISSRVNGAGENRRMLRRPAIVFSSNTEGGFK